MKITVLYDVQSTDATIGAVPTLNWSVVEVGTRVICACVITGGRSNSIYEVTYLNDPTTAGSRRTAGRWRGP